MPICRANHSKLIRVDAQVGLEAQPTAQRGAHVVARLWFVLSPTTLDIKGVGFKISKRIVRRER